MLATVGCDSDSGSGGSLLTAQVDKQIRKNDQDTEKAQAREELERIMLSEGVIMNGKLAETGKSIALDQVRIYFRKLTGTFGQKRYAQASYGQIIEVDPEGWATLSEPQKRRLISHELVHILFQQNDGDPAHATHEVDNFEGIEITTLTSWWN